MLSVSDRGPGIPEEKLNAVSAPFFTSKAEGMGAVHRAHHHRRSQRTDMGGKSRSRRRVVPEQTSYFQ